MPTSTLRAILTGALAVAVITTACATIMGVEEPQRRRDGATVDNDGGVNPSPTATNTDSGAAPVPEPPCVNPGCPCTKADDRCPANMYCQDAGNGQSVCAVGCKIDDECRALNGDNAPKCNTTRHQCVQCTDPSQCTGPSMTCSPSGSCTSKCVSGASGASGCTNGQECCGEVCVDLNKDDYNCGKCGTSCAATGGVCCSRSCKSTQTDLANCGVCGKACTDVRNATAECKNGGCGYTQCTGGFADCDGNKANGCECTCPLECTSCVTGKCIIECSKRSGGCSGSVTITCPAGRDCIVVAREGSPTASLIINCPIGKNCTLDCDGPSGTCSSTELRQGTACISCRGNSGTCTNIECRGTCSKSCDPANRCTDTVCQNSTCPDVAVCP